MQTSYKKLVVYIIYTIEIIHLKIFIDSAYLIPNIYIIEILQYTFSTEMIFIVVYVLKEFLNEQKKDNQSFAVFIIFGVK